MKEGEGDVVLLLGGHRHGEQDRELLGVEITPTRDCHDASLPFHQTCAQDVHERADGARGWRSVVSRNIKQDGRALGARDVRETERG